MQLRTRAVYRIAMHTRDLPIFHFCFSCALPFFLWRADKAFERYKRLLIKDQRTFDLPNTVCCFVVYLGGEEKGVEPGL